jgi:hypothetical protein
MRQLSTIGDLAAARPAARSRSRRASMGAVHASMGQTNTAFAPPTPGQVSTNPPGDTLSSAANSLLIYIQQHGTPSIHEDNQTVLQFQTAWNADPLSDSNGANSQLSEDGGYGPNTHAALASIAGTAPAVNPGTTPAVTPPIPAPVPGPAPVPPLVIPHPLVTPAHATTSHTGMWLLLGAAAVAAYFLLRKKKRGGGSVIVKTNPRRRRRRAA